MKISCPSCPATYNILNDKIPANGIKTKCKKCGGNIFIPPDIESNKSKQDRNIKKTVRVSCPSCSAIYNIPEDRIPSKGAKTKCKKCGGEIVVPPLADNIKSELHIVSDKDIKSAAPSISSNYKFNHKADSVLVKVKTTTSTAISEARNGTKNDISQNKVKAFAINLGFLKGKEIVFGFSALLILAAFIGSLIFSYDDGSDESANASTNNLDLTSNSTSNPDNFNGKCDACKIPQNIIMGDYTNGYIKNVELNRVEIKNSNFSNYLFENTIISNLDISHTNFRNVEFKDSTIEFANADHVDFENTNFSNTLFYGGKYNRFNIKGARGTLTISSNIDKINIAASSFSSLSINNKTKLDISNSEILNLLIEDVKQDNDISIKCDNVRINNASITTNALANKLLTSGCIINDVKLTSGESFVDNINELDQEVHELAARYVAVYKEIKLYSDNLRNCCDRKIYLETKIPDKTQHKLDELQNTNIRSANSFNRIYRNEIMIAENLLDNDKRNEEIYRIKNKIDHFYTKLSYLEGAKNVIRDRYAIAEKDFYKVHNRKATLGMP